MLLEVVVNIRSALTIEFGFDNVEISRNNTNYTDFSFVDEFFSFARFITAARTDSAAGRRILKTERCQQKRRNAENKMFESLVLKFVKTKKISFYIKCINYEKKIMGNML